MTITVTTRKPRKSVGAHRCGNPDCTRFLIIRRPRSSDKPVHFVQLTNKGAWIDTLLFHYDCLPHGKEEAVKFIRKLKRRRPK